MTDVTAAEGAGKARLPSGLPTFGDIAAMVARPDIGMAIAVMGILVVLIFPMPAVLLDLLLTARRDDV